MNFINEKIIIKQIRYQDVYLNAHLLIIKSFIEDKRRYFNKNLLTFINLGLGFFKKTIDKIYVIVFVINSL